MILTHLTLLELIQGASDEQIAIMAPVSQFGDISTFYSIDYTPSKRRKRLMRDAYLALRRGHGERMRHQLIERLEGAMLAGLTRYEIRDKPAPTRRSVRARI
jgi:hypothetical protein